ncbi:RusA family crossover junction endodeoxyribonuclease [Lentibacillus cibarius]|uniref:Uncharacterized protein n=1 Tax=Lentibacillus cibarius TaxID=2583219 RepID=A0A5S3QJ21_9BACI|nr:hypothetical protein [Lentibacillus cibarius]TMN21914.1 hypothetical protein FFL34_07140 [Lentibacillus cibarius]
MDVRHCVQGLSDVVLPFAPCYERILIKGCQTICDSCNYEKRFVRHAISEILLWQFSSSEITSDKPVFKEGGCTMTKNNVFHFPTEQNKGATDLVNTFPVLHFSIEGRLPHKDVDRKTYVEARDYFLDQILDTYDWEDLGIEFNRAIAYIANYFKSPRIRDLDNLNRKSLIDGLRKTLVIKNDGFYCLSHMGDGFYDGERDHIELFVMERKHIWDFGKLWDVMGLNVLAAGDLNEDDTLEEPIKPENQLESAEDFWENF